MTSRALLDELVTLLSLTKIEENLFLGQSQDLGWGTVYGGQVMGQAVSAAAGTVDPLRPIHSLHAYFLRRGDTERPILYSVQRLRDGGSFSSRRVEAIQNGEVICEVMMSFHRREPGLEHTTRMPNVPPPDEAVDETAYVETHRDELPAALYTMATRPRPFETRLINPPASLAAPAKQDASRAVWFRTRGTVGNELSVHAALLAYASDRNFLMTSLLPHGVSWLTPGMRMASLDHAVWFHRPFRVDEWILFDMHSPSASDARGLVLGRMFARDGTLIASAAQEGLIRRTNI